MKKLLTLALAGAAILGTASFAYGDGRHPVTPKEPKKEFHVVETGENIYANNRVQIHYAGAEVEKNGEERAMFEQVCHYTEFNPPIKTSRIYTTGKGKKVFVPRTCPFGYVANLSALEIKVGDIDVEDGTIEIHTQNR